MRALHLSALALLCSTLSAQAGATFGREIRYPTRYEAESGPAGVVMVPQDFVTRETGAILEGVVAGVAMVVEADGRPAVRLQLEDGRTLVTRTGMWIKMDGVIYRALGWQDDGFHLLSRSGNKRIRFIVRR
jgi:hypothetical protein